LLKRQSLPAPEAFIFDLDGTLTIPQLDFEVIRKEMGIAAGPILEELELLDDETAARARKVLEKHEEQAASTAVLQEGGRSSRSSEEENCQQPSSPVTAASLSILYFSCTGSRLTPPSAVTRPL